MTVYFATNRKRSSDGAFGPGLGAQLTFGVADAAGAVAHLSAATFLPDVVRDIATAAPDHLLISIHGFNYTFEESLQRAEADAVWFASGAPSVTSTVIALCWPSNGHLDVFDYMDDYRDALASARDVGDFLLAMKYVIDEWRHMHPKGRVTMLCHSMGNHVLRHGVEGVALGRRVGIFDRLLLIAADADAASIMPIPPNGLFQAIGLAKETVVYFYPRDIALDASRALHLRERVGHVGAPDTTREEFEKVAFVDVSSVDDLDERIKFDPEGHQYYHVLPAVRDDICAEMLGLATKAVYDRERNVFTLTELEEV